MAQLIDTNPNLQQQILSDSQTQTTALNNITTGIGNINDAAATSDTQNTGLNSLFKRHLQRFTTLITSIGAPSDAAATSDTGTFSLIALIKKGLQTLTSIATNTANGGETPLNTLNAPSASVAITAATSAPIFSAVSGVKKVRIYLLNTGLNSLDVCYAATATSATKVTSIPAGFLWNDEWAGAVSVISTGTSSVQVTRITA